MGNNAPNHKEHKRYRKTIEKALKEKRDGK